VQNQHQRQHRETQFHEDINKEYMHHMYTKFFLGILHQNKLMTCQKSICLKSYWNKKFISCVNLVHQSYFVKSKNIMHIPMLNTNTYGTQISLVQFLIIKIEVIQILNSKPNPLESDDHTMNIQISLCINL